MKKFRAELSFLTQEKLITNTSEVKLYACHIAKEAKKQQIILQYRTVKIHNDGTAVVDLYVKDTQNRQTIVDFYHDHNVVIGYNDGGWL